MLNKNCGKQDLQAYYEPRLSRYPERSEQFLKLTLERDLVKLEHDSNDQRRTYCGGRDVHQCLPKYCLSGHSKGNRISKGKDRPEAGRTCMEIDGFNKGAGVSNWNLGRTSS